MSRASNGRRLFDEFPPVPTEQWEAQILQDLKGDDYGERLLWHTLDGFTVRPYYRAEDLQKVGHLGSEIPDVTFPRPWTIRQDVFISGLDQAKEDIRQALDGGAESIGLIIGRGGISGINILSPDDVERLISDVPLEGIPLHLDAGAQSPALAGKLKTLRGRYPITVGSLAFDPLGDAARSGYLSDGDLDLAARLVREEGARSLCIEARVFHDAGATVVQEAALVLASISEYLSILIEKGARVADIASRLFLSIPVSTSYFLEIAKLRAIRLLVPQVLDAFSPGAGDEQLPIHCVTSRRSMTRYDPHMNLLRTTTEASAAIIGGCDVLAVQPFDAVAEIPNGFSYRLTRNVQLILRHEAHLDKVGDPAAGSYYIEALTDIVAQRAWQLFKDVEARGGLLSAFESGEIHRLLDESSSGRMQELVHGRRTLVGINRYPVVSSSPPAAAIPAVSGPAPAAGDGAESETPGLKRVGTPLPARREAEVFEALRHRAEEVGRHRGSHPAAVVLGLGEAATRAVRAGFAADMLGAGGFRVHIRYDDSAPNAPDGAPNAPDAAPDVLVFAAPDAMYPELLADAYRIFDSAALRPILAIVAEPGILDYLEQPPDILMHEGNDAADTLHRILERIEA